MSDTMRNKQDLKAERGEEKQSWGSESELVEGRADAGECLRD